MADGTFTVADMRFSVRATDARFLALLRGYLAPFERGEHPGYHMFSADGGVSRTLAGGKPVRGKQRLYKHALTIYHGRSPDEMAGRLVSSVRDMVTGFADEFLRLRAGAAELDGSVVLLPSAPNPHLPALVAALVGRGAGYLGDEVVHVDPVLRHVHPVTRDGALPLLLDTTDLEHFPGLVKRAGRRGRTARGHASAGAVTDRVPVTLPELGGRRGHGGAVGHLLHPTFDLGGPTLLQPLLRSEALFVLAGALLNPEVWTDRALLVLREVVGGARAHRLVVGSYEQAAELVAGVVRGEVGG